MSDDDQLIDIGIDASQYLNAEEKKTFDTVRGTMDTWIDQRVASLARDMEGKLQTMKTELESEVEMVEKTLSESQQKITDLLSRIEALESDLDLGDGLSLQEAISQTKDVVAKAKDDMETFKTRWRSVGSGVVDKAVTAIKTAIL